MKAFYAARSFGCHCFFYDDFGVSEVPAAAPCHDPHDGQDARSKSCRQQVSRRKAFGKAIMVSGRIGAENSARGSMLDAENM